MKRLIYVFCACILFISCAKKSAVEKIEDIVTKYEQKLDKVESLSDFEVFTADFEKDLAKFEKDYNTSTLPESEQLKIAEKLGPLNMKITEKSLKLGNSISNELELDSSTEDVDTGDFGEDD